MGVSLKKMAAQIAQIDAAVQQIEFRPASALDIAVLGNSVQHRGSE